MIYLFRPRPGGKIKAMEKDAGPRGAGEVYAVEAGRARDAKALLTRWRELSGRELSNAERDLLEGYEPALAKVEHVATWETCGECGGKVKHR